MNMIVSVAAWQIVPDAATRFILHALYKTTALTNLLRIVPSEPGTPQYRRHYGAIFSLVVVGYLLYTLIDQARAVLPNFYQILGVPHTVDDTGLKLAFRQFAKKNHPDRPGIGRQGEAAFIYVRDAFEALKDPATRFAYDRFGPDALGWRQTCSTTREFLRHGMLASSGYHIVSFVVLLFWSAVGQASPMSFWRYILFASLLASEFALILSPTSPRFTTILHYIFPHRIVYQHILFLHQLFMFLNVALLRVTPWLIPHDELADPRVEQVLLERTAALLNRADVETSKLIHTELQSISTDEASKRSLSTSSTARHPSLVRMEPIRPSAAAQLLQELAPEMENLIVEANVKKSSGPLKTAWDAALARAHAKLVELRLQRGADDETEAGHDEEEEEVLREPSLEPEQGINTPRGSRETTPTPISQSTSSPSPFIPPPQTPVHTQSSPSRNHVTPNGSSPGVVVVKQEELEELGSSLMGGSGYYLVSPAKPAAAQPSTPRSMNKKSVPRTPGELPSPRPSPSPPPPRSPSKPYAQARGTVGDED